MNSLMRLYASWRDGSPRAVAQVQRGAWRRLEWHMGDIARLGHRDISATTGTAPPSGLG